MAAAPSSVPADRDEAFVWDTVNDIGWHGLECDIIVFFNRDGVKMGHTQGAIGNQILFVCRYNTCVPFIASSVIKQMLLL